VVGSGGGVEFICNVDASLSRRYVEPASGVGGAAEVTRNSGCSSIANIAFQAWLYPTAKPGSGRATLYRVYFHLWPRELDIENVRRGRRPVWSIYILRVRACPGKRAQPPGMTPAGGSSTERDLASRPMLRRARILFAASIFPLSVATYAGTKKPAPISPMSIYI